MKKKSVIEIGVSQYEIFQNHFSDASSKGNKDAIHQLRVSLKKFYALKKFVLNGMSPIGQAQLINYLEPIHLIYKSGGKIRDIQVITDIATNFSTREAPPVFINKLQERYKYRFEKFKALTQTIELPTLAQFEDEYKSLITRYYTTSEKLFDGFLNDNMKNAREFIISSEPGELWHDARTLIKQNYLLMLLAQSFEPGQVDITEIQNLRNIEQMLGQWHDLVVLKKFALRFDIAGPNENPDYFNSVINETRMLEKSVLKIFEN